MSKIKDFHNAYLDFEKLNIGGFDALNHTGVNDLWFLVRHEIDLFEESKETSIKDVKQLNKAKRYLIKYGG